jgi:S1 RNA binding domain protein
MADPIAVDSVVDGRITGVTKFGAFVDLGEGRVGLIHISQIANSYVTDVAQHVKVGDTVKIRVIGVTKDGKYDLSIKQLEKREVVRSKEMKKAPNSFEDKMTMFLKQSEEKLLDWKKNLQGKQEGKKPKKF